MAVCEAERSCGAERKKRVGLLSGRVGVPPGSGIRGGGSRVCGDGSPAPLPFAPSAPFPRRGPPSPSAASDPFKFFSLSPFSYFRASSRTPRSLLRLRPQIRRDDPLNLSILLSGGKETNQDSLSSGERRGKSPAPNPRPTGGRGKCGVRKTACPVSLGGLSPSDRGSARGRCEAGNGPRRAGVRSSRSRVVWECSPKRVVNSI